MCLRRGEELGTSRAPLGIHGLDVRDPDVEKTAYPIRVGRRLEVRDQIARLCIDGTSKFPSFLLPTIETQLERGGPIGGGALALAGWAHYLATVPAAERAPDPHGNEAALLARQAASDPLAFLELDIFGEHIRTSERFHEAFARASRQLAELGPRAAMASL